MLSWLYSIYDNISSMNLGKAITESWNSACQNCHELAEPKDGKQMLVVLVLVMVMDDCGNGFTIEKSNLGEYLEQI